MADDYGVKELSYSAEAVIAEVKARFAARVESGLEQILGRETLDQLDITITNAGAEVFDIGQETGLADSNRDIIVDFVRGALQDAEEELRGFFG